VTARDPDLDKLEAAAILERAAARAQAMGLHYAGAVTPQEAYELREVGAAKIVDVRTPMEWREIGHPLEAPLIEWPRAGGPEAWGAFIEGLRAQFDPGEKLLFICRSGVRSHYAAELAARAGFGNTYNVLEGFEGEQGAGHNGWRAAGLPWKKG
jgi:rhodanese-related sulfurtransferase